MADNNLGPYRINFKDEFDPSEEYRYLDAVRYKGGSYVCKNLDTIDGVACIGILPTGEARSELYWWPMALPGEKGDPADTIRPFQTITDGKWDLSMTDKIYIPDEAVNDLELLNPEDGFCGLIITRKDLTLPPNSYKGVDFDYLEVTSANDVYLYTFCYSTSLNPTGRYFWKRSVLTKE